MRILYFDCFSGAAGDMILGALLDVGASEQDVRDSWAALNLPGWTAERSTVARGAISAQRVEILAEDQVASRTLPELRRIVQEARLAPGTARLSLDILDRLAAAEAKVHGTDVANVHLHEAGGVDALLDIVGCATALEHLGRPTVVTSSIATGRGFIRSAHGTIPLPAPAVTELLRGATLYERGSDELVTPTGAAILATITDRFGSMPPMTMLATGYGAGKRDSEVPNVVRALLGDVEDAHPSTAHVLIETNIDDMNPELIPHVIEKLMAAGADDAWTTPIVMKKGRPAITLSVLGDQEHRDGFLDVIYSETTTLGVRIRDIEKHELERSWTEASVDGYPVRVKLGSRDGRVTTRSPEYEDALKVASITGLPLREVYRLALAELEEGQPPRR